MKKVVNVFLIALTSFYCASPVLSQVPAKPTDQSVARAQDQARGASNTDQKPIVADSIFDTSLSSSVQTVVPNKPWVPEFGAEGCASFDLSVSNYAAASDRIVNENPGTVGHLKWVRRATEAGYCMIWGLLDQGETQVALTHLDRMEAWLKPYDTSVPAAAARLSLARIAWVKGRIALEAGKTEEDNRHVQKVLSLTIDRNNYPEDYAGLSSMRIVALWRWKGSSQIKDPKREACSIAEEMENLLKGSATRRSIECLTIEADAALKKRDEPRLLKVVERAKALYAENPSIYIALPAMQTRLREVNLASTLGQAERAARLQIGMLEELAQMFDGVAYFQHSTDELSTLYTSLSCDCVQQIPEYAQDEQRHRKNADVFSRLSNALRTSLERYPRNLSYASVAADVAAKATNAFNRLQDWQSASVYAERAVQVAEQADMLAQINMFSEQGAAVCNVYGKAVETYVGTRSIMDATSALIALDDNCGAWLQRYPWDFYARQHMISAKWKYGVFIADTGDTAKAVAALQFASNWGNSDASRSLVRIYSDASSPIFDEKKAEDLGRLTAKQRMKRFTVPTDFAGTKYPFHMYVMEYGDAPRCPSDRSLTPEETNCVGFVAIDDQVTWVKEARGGIVPTDVVESFQKLYKIANENSVSFPDLCEYALGLTTKSELVATQEHAKSIHTQMISSEFQRNGDRWLDSAGLALRGYDPVSYMQGQKPVLGNGAFYALWDGALWLFSSVANRDQFLRTPDRYAPHYGGFSATEITQGKVSGADPEIFSIIGERLFLFDRLEHVADWNAQSKDLIAQADARWIAIFPAATDADSALSKMIIEMGPIPVASSGESYARNCTAGGAQACGKLFAYLSVRCADDQSIPACDMSIRLAETTPNLAPMLVSMLGSRSWYHALANNSDAAITDATRALSIDPNQPWISVNLANGLLLKGKVAAAITLYKAKQDKPTPDGKGVMCPVLHGDIDAMLAKKLISQKIADRVRKAIVCKPPASAS